MKKLQTSKEKNSAIGDLIISLKSQIISDLKGQNPVVLAKVDGEPCCSYVGEEHVSQYPFTSQNRADLELSRPHEWEQPSPVEVLAIQCLMDAFSDTSMYRYQATPSQIPSYLVELLF